MPYTNEHAARIREPNSFVKGTMRSKSLGVGIRIIIGKLPGEETMKTQAYRFDKDYFTPTEARKWLIDHGIKYISFEAATGS